MRLIRDLIIWLKLAAKTSLVWFVALLDETCYRFPSILYLQRWDPRYSCRRHPCVVDRSVRRLRLPPSVQLRAPLTSPLSGCVAFGARYIYYYSFFAFAFYFSFMTFFILIYVISVCAVAGVTSWIMNSWLWNKWKFWPLQRKKEANWLMKLLREFFFQGTKTNFNNGELTVNIKIEISENYYADKGN